MPELEIRRATAEDHEACSRVLYEAFADIAARHGFPPDFETPDRAALVMGFLLGSCFGVVAERDGRILGSNFLKQDDPVAAVGPISVDPALQESGIGRVLMQSVLERGRRAHAIRLVQDAFNATSMALYASLGFEVREPLVLVRGRARGATDPRCTVRALVADDVDECAALCRKVHGVDRSQELRRAIPGFRPRVAVRDGRITAYATSVAFWFAAHGVAESDDDLCALLQGASEDEPEGIELLLPSRRTTLFRWALESGLRIVKPMSLMTVGPYQEPGGGFFPSVGY